MHDEFLDISMTKKKTLLQTPGWRDNSHCRHRPLATSVCADSPLPPSAQDPSSSFFKPTAQPACGIFLDSSLAKDMCGSEVLLLQF